MLIPLKYIGKRESYTEGTYGSNIVFTKGETVLVDAELAEKLLRHPDCYVRGEEVDAPSAVIPKRNPHTELEDTEAAQEARDLIANMDKPALIEYAKVNYRMDLDGRKSVASLRTEVIQLVDLSGVV